MTMQRIHEVVMCTNRSSLPRTWSMAFTSLFSSFRKILFKYQFIHWQASVRRISKLRSYGHSKQKRKVEMKHPLHGWQHALHVLLRIIYHTAAVWANV